MPGDTKDTKDTKDTVLSLLCGPEVWQFDPNASCNISFNKNGTGLLWAGAEISVFIAAEFDWEIKSSESLDTVVDLSSFNNLKDTLISEFDIELTLTTRIHPILRKTRNDYTLLNEQALTDAAFLPKNYTVRLEHGRFDDPSTPWINWNSPPFWFRPDKYALRLLFDKSPFPPSEEWNEEVRGIAKQCHFWEIKEFVDLHSGVPKDSWLATLMKKVSS